MLFVHLRLFRLSRSEHEVFCRYYEVMLIFFVLLTIGGHGCWCYVLVIFSFVWVSTGDTGNNQGRIQDEVLYVAQSYVLIT